MSLVKWKYMSKLIVIVFVITLLTGCAKTSSYQIIEKGEYSRLQYVTAEGIMAPNFVNGYYIVLRDGETGAESKVQVSEEEYDACVVGDMVEK